MKKVILKIQGMNCASCVRRIESNLSKKKGISSVKVNLASEKALIQIDESLISMDEIFKAIKNLGFKASTSTPKHSPWNLYLSLIISFVLMSPMMGLFHIPSWIQFLLATPVQFYFARDFYLSSWGALKAKNGNMELLVLLGTLSSYFFSVFLMTKKPEAHLYFETSAMVISLVMLGKHLEQKAKRKTLFALESLKKLRPTNVSILQSDQSFKVCPLSDLRLDDEILIKAGEVIPADGDIVKGISEVDESLVTGESLPSLKKEGNHVIGGSLNIDGPLHVKVTATEDDTFLSKMMNIIETSQLEKIPIQRLVDKMSSYFVPLVLLFALTTLVYHLSQGLNLETALLRSVSVLVIACPCALGLATPTALIVSSGLAAQRGILIKDPDVLETSHRVTSVVFDKTGTITEGSPSVERIHLIDKNHLNEEDFLKLYASLIQESEHPLAKSVLQFFKKELFPVSDTKILPGRGVEAKVKENLFLVCSQKYATELGFLIDLDEPTPHQLHSNALSRSYLINLSLQKALGFISFHDPIKKGVKKLISSLHQMNIKTFLLTGDSQLTAEHVANLTGIKHYQGEVLPLEKKEIIEKLKTQGEMVIMLGDGLNDAPALSYADVGIAMAQGQDITLQHSSLTFLHNDPSSLLTLLKISHKTISKIRQNLFWAMFYNTISLPIAALGYLSPMLAGAAMALSSISVVLNSLSIKKMLRGEDASPL